MSLHNHLVELERRHQALEKQITAAQHHPSASEREITELKRKKLQVKDQIVKLRAKVPDQTLH
jgi:hypothetical protein